MHSREGVRRSATIVIYMLATGVLWAPASLRAGQSGDLVRQIEAKLSSVQRQTVTSPNQAEKDLLAARDLLGQLKEASAGQEKLPALQKRFDDLKGKLEKRLGRPVGGSAEAPKQEAAPAPSQPPVSNLPSAVVSQLKKLDTALTAAATSLEKNQLQTANRRLDEAKKVMNEIQSRYGTKIPAGNEQMKTATERLNTVAAKVSDANANAAAVAAAEAAAKEKREAQSKEWKEKFAPFFDYKSDLYLRMGSEFNNASPEDQQKARQAYGKANELIPAYQATEFPNGKTQELEYLEQRLMGYVTIYNEDEARSKQEQSCRKWMDAFRPYVEVGAGSPKYLVVGVTVDQDEIGKRAALLEEAKTLWQSYEGSGEFPHGKSRELLAFEEQMQQRLAEMPEALRQSRALVSADVDKEFTRILDYLTTDTGWKEDITKKPNVVMERDLTPLREALQRFANMAGADAAKLVVLRETMGKIEQQDQANRVVRAERTYLEPDQYEGEDADDLRRKAGQIVKDKIAQAEILRATLPAEDWQQESVVEWTDTTHTVLRYRNTRSMTAHVAAKGADSKVFLHAVHLASDRQTDGSWGSLYGHIMWSDWMAEKNVNEDPPSP